MITKDFLEKLNLDLNSTKSLGLFKKERIILEEQGSNIKVEEIANFISNFLNSFLT